MSPRQVYHCPKCNICNACSNMTKFKREHLYKSFNNTNIRDPNKSVVYNKYSLTHNMNDSTILKLNNNNKVIKNYTDLTGYAAVSDIYDTIDNQLVLKQVFHALDETNFPTFLPHSSDT
jgi:hypothetical protein